MSEDDVLFGYRRSCHVEAQHATILDECWRPAFARYLYPASAASGASSSATSASATTTASTTAASAAAVSPPKSSTARARSRRDEPSPSAHLGGCRA